MAANNFVARQFRIEFLKMYDAASCSLDVQVQ